MRSIRRWLLISCVVCSVVLSLGVFFKYALSENVSVTIIAQSSENGLRVEHEVVDQGVIGGSQALFIAIGDDRHRVAFSTGHCELGATIDSVNRVTIKIVQAPVVSEVLLTVGVVEVGGVRVRVHVDDR